MRRVIVAAQVVSQLAELRMQHGTVHASGKFALGGGADARAPVSAHIVESANLAAVVTIDDDALVANLPQEKVAWVGNLIGTSGADPALTKEAFQLVGEDGRVGVIARRKRLANAVDMRRHQKAP